MSENDTSSAANPQVPESGTDSRVEDWHGQSVQEDADLADELVRERGMEGAEKEFERRAKGEATQANRRGESIDPDQGESAYKNSPDSQSSDEVSP